MNKRFWLILGIIAAVFIGVLLFRGGDEANNSNNNGSGGTPSSHTIGTSPKNLTLIEVGDYQCPYCSVYAPVFKQVAEKYKDQVVFQFRHYPLQQIHSNAFAAARAAEAAGIQDKFWEMHEMLYANQNSWSNSSNAKAIFEGYAKQLGLDEGKFETDYASKTVNATINADMREFEKTGFRVATPSFILDGKQIKPEATVESFSKIIDEALAKE